MVRFLLILVLAGICFTSQAQNKLKFGKIDIENLKMEYYAPDSSAGAVILADYGYTSFDHNFEISYTRHTRIKIFNSSEFDRADFEIPHFRGDMVSRLKAATYNLEDGKMVEYPLDKRKETNKYKQSESVDVLSFGLSNVKEGSIIEVTYQVNYGSWLRIMPWYFQYDIPVMYSEYRVVLPDVFVYKPILTGYIQLEETTSGYQNVSYQGSQVRSREVAYIARNVPAFIEEPNITTVEDYISKISFQLAEINAPTTHETIMQSSYEALSREMASWDRYTSEVDKRKFVREDVARLVSGLDSDIDKANAIYSWVQENFTREDHDEENWSKIYEMRLGNSYEINFILLLMLKEAGLDAEPVRLSTRSNGLLHPFYPSRFNFNYLLCLVTDGENEYLLDASDDYLEFNMLGKDCLNGKGLVISSSNPRWVELDRGVKSVKMITANVRLDEEGNAVGTLNIARTGYTALEFRKNNSESPDNYKESLQEAMNKWTINSHEIEGMDETGGQVKDLIELEIPEYAASMGDIIYINPIIMPGIDENPYKLEERVYPVDYAAPFKYVLIQTIEIPDGYSVDEAPASIALSLPENAGKFIYSVKVNANTISLAYQFMINKTMFIQNEYPYLRAFYDQIVAKQQEQVVLKKSL